jgi:hypothetical protein
LSKARSDTNAPGVQLLDRDLTAEHAILVLGDQIHVGAQRVERALHLGQHRPRHLGDHGQAVAPADVPAQVVLPVAWLPTK